MNKISPYAILYSIAYGYSFVKEVIILELVLAIGIIALIVVLIFCLLNMARDKRYHDEYIKMIDRAMSVSPNVYLNNIQYTTEFLKYLDTIITSATNISFRQWMANNADTTKITRIRMKQLVDETAKRIYDSLILMNVDHSSLLVSNEYWTWYIVNLTIALLNERFEKALVEIIDE